MTPEAPVRFSTMNCCFSDSLSFAAKMRASGSTEPPGGYGETNLTTRVGHSCASAGKEKRKRASSLKSDIPSSLQLQHVARLVRRGDGEAELFQDAPRLRHLLGIGSRELAAAEPQAVFQPDAHVAAHDGAHRSDEHLVASSAEHRPVIRVAEKAIGGALHVEHILGMRADAAADAEYRLDEERRLEQAPLDEVRRDVKMPDVVALDLKARVVLGARLEDVGDVLEGVLEDALIRPGEVGLLPVVLELLVAAEHLVETEVHRAHVE